MERKIKNRAFNAQKLLDRTLQECTFRYSWNGQQDALPSCGKEQAQPSSLTRTLDHESFMQDIKTFQETT